MYFVPARGAVPLPGVVASIVTIPAIAAYRGLTEGTRIAEFLMLIHSVAPRTAHNRSLGAGSIPSKTERAEGVNPARGRNFFPSGGGRPTF